MYRDPDEQSRAAALDEARADAAEQRADTAHTDDRSTEGEAIYTSAALTRNELARARLLQVRREFDALRNRMSDLLDIVTVGDDDTELWLRALETAASTARSAAKYCEQHLREAEPIELARREETLRALRRGQPLALVGLS